MKMHKIVITGGPCGGKTTALSWLQNAFTLRGYKVIIVPETATELIPAASRPGPAAQTWITRNARWPFS